MRTLRHSTAARLVSPPAAGDIDWTGRRVTVMGLGRHGGGVGATRYLASRGALVTVSDVDDRAKLATSIAQLGDVPLAALRLGGHARADFTTAQFVVVNPAVRFDHPLLGTARDCGAVLTSEIELFLRACPATVVGVTGSNGKSTTSAMLAAILTAAGRQVWLGGNFGGSLLGDLGRMTRDDWVVLELSSFQLVHLSETAPRPTLALVTNCTPNHLDWHGDFDRYARAKQRLIVGQAAGTVAILNPHDPISSAWAAPAPGRTRVAWPLERVGSLVVPGLHNRHNAACAAAAAEAAGVSDEAIREALANFQGLDHRLQRVAEVAGRRFYNDSKSTTPEATAAALEAIDSPVWLLAGGQAKATSFEALAGSIIERARGAALFGAARDTLRTCITAQRGDFAVHACERLCDALDWCWQRSRPGDAILLSPACASHDQFADFAARGAAFCRLVRGLAARGSR